MADYRDPSTYHDTVDMTNATLTPPTNHRLLKTLAIPFVLADITAGSKVSASLPANALIVGGHISVTTPLTFSGGDTDGVTCETGNADTDGFTAKVAIAGAAGIKRPTAGALSNSVVAGSTGNCVVTFAATGGAPDLADVTAGAGTVYIHYYDMA